jgi:hypothetical protein
VNVPGDVQIKRVTSAWSESTVTWNARPGIDSQVSGARPITMGDAGKVVTIDITNLALLWARDPAHNFGLAIVAAPGSRVEAYFSSRESGAAPILHITTNPSDNIATVGKSGAEYTDPVTAARNAYAGDTWCQSPTVAAPCRIQVAQGVFILQETLSLPNLVSLAGAGKDITLLIARRGIEVAVATGLGGPSDIADLAIVNSQSSTSRAVGVDLENQCSLARVAIHVSGSVSPTAIDASSTAGNVTVVDSAISAHGGQTAVGMRLAGPDGQLRNLTVAATGGTLENIGIDNPNVFIATMLNVEALADGGNRAVAAQNRSHEDGNTPSITDSRFTARSNAVAIGLSMVNVAGGSVLRTRAFALGGTSGVGASIGLDGPPQGSPITIEGLVAAGNTVALSVAGGRSQLLKGVHLTSEGTALRSEIDFATNTIPVIEDSFLEAPVAIDIGNGFDDFIARHLTNVVLAGERRNIGGLSCTEVYDENYDLLDASCR